MTLEKFIEWKESRGIEHEQDANKDNVLIWSRYEPPFTKY